MLGSIVSHIYAPYCIQVCNLALFSAIKVLQTTHSVRYSNHHMFNEGPEHIWGRRKYLSLQHRRLLSMHFLENKRLYFDSNSTEACFFGFYSSDKSAFAHVMSWRRTGNAALLKQTRESNHTQNESLQWRHNEHDEVSNHRRREYLLNHFFMRRSKKTSKAFVNKTSMAFVRGIHRWPGNSQHNGSVKRKVFPFDDVIMFLHPKTSGRVHVVCKVICDWHTADRVFGHLKPTSTW